MSLIRFQRRTPTPSAFAPFSTFSIADEVPRVFRRLFDDSLEFRPFGQTIGFVPAMEVVETPKELILTAELPGMTKKDVLIGIEEGVLTLKGEKSEMRKEKEDDDTSFHLWERTYGSFERVFRLPLAVDAAKITAEFANGVLTVHLPKMVPAPTNGRKIEITEKV